MLDESSAGAEVGVIWDATWARLEQCNTCFEKIDTFPVHLGLDRALSRVSLHLQLTLSRCRLDVNGVLCL